MCYYSTSLRADEFRDAKAEGENLRIGSGAHEHNLVYAESDGKIVCMLNGTRVHFERVELSYTGRTYKDSRYMPEVSNMLGKPMSGTFIEWHGGHAREGYAADAILFDNGVKLHLVHLGQGLRFYSGEKKLDLETNLGVNDPSIGLDHKVEETPTVARTLARAGVCSIQR